MAPLMSAGSVIGGFTGILLLIVAGKVTIGIYNDIVLLRNDINKAWANIDVLLKQRNDEIPNLVEVVKGYRIQELTLLEKIAETRRQMLNEDEIPDLASSDSDLTEELNQLFALAEAYPQLKSDKTFIKLQSRITRLENDIADRRELYNDVTTRYNTKISSLPSLLVRPIFGWRHQPLFSLKESIPH